jgi:hypothetical protein
MALNFSEKHTQNNGLLVTLDIYHKQFGLRQIYIVLNTRYYCMAMNWRERLLCSEPWCGGGGGFCAR